MGKRLYKSNKDKMLDGVCGGLAEYFGVDPTLIRLAWVLLCAMGGSGVVAYIVAAICKVQLCMGEKLYRKTQTMGFFNDNTTCDRIV